MSSYFLPISVGGAFFRSTHASRKRNPFNDTRLHQIWLQINERLVSEQKRSILQIATNASQSARFYRFFSNDRVSKEELIKMNCAIPNQVLNHRHVVCLGDSSTFNLSKRLGRIKDQDKLGVLQDGKTAGFFTHVNLAVDAHNSAILGLADVLYWMRPKGVKPPKASARIEEKESFKWFLGARNAHKVLQAAQKLTYVFDREADNFELLNYLQNELKSDFVIRSNHDRKVTWQDKQLLLSQCMSQSQAAGKYEIDLPAQDHYSWTCGKRIRRKARKAQMEIRYEAVQVSRPKGVKADQPLNLYVVEAKEITPDLPADESPVCWRLWTTHLIDSLQTAQAIIAYYLMRWIIEQLFRTMKKKGFDQEATELESVDGILKQTTMILKAAVQVLQLVYARNRYDAQPINDVFDQEEQIVLEKVNEQLQGKTEKQKNPYPRNQLSWAAWIIARLGGWKGYQSQKPPGPMTMKWGLDKMNTMIEAYRLFNTS
jgi:hypothetical protein